MLDGTLALLAARFAIAGAVTRLRRADSAAAPIKQPFVKQR
jgi:hypothetical protein